MIRYLLILLCLIVGCSKKDKDEDIWHFYVEHFVEIEPYSEKDWQIDICEKNCTEIYHDHRKALGNPEISLEEEGLAIWDENWTFCSGENHSVIHIPRKNIKRIKEKRDEVIIYLKEYQKPDNCGYVNKLRLPLITNNPGYIHYLEEKQRYVMFFYYLQQIKVYLDLWHISPRVSRRYILEYIDKINSPKETYIFRKEIIENGKNKVTYDIYREMYRELSAKYQMFRFKNKELNHNSKQMRWGL